MPIYEYECQGCGHVFDALQKISDDPLSDCPECGEARLRKLLSAPNFRLKGGGWYETDFKGANQRNLAASGDAAKPDGKSNAKTEGKASKTEGKSESKPSDKKASGGDAGSS